MRLFFISILCLIPWSSFGAAAGLKYQGASAVLSNLTANTSHTATNVNPSQLSLLTGTVGITNAASITNAQLISPTNSPTLSNQTVATFNGLVGQTGDISTFTSNSTALFAIKPSSALWLRTNVGIPAQIPGGSILWNSNSALWWITATKTNLISNGL